MHPNTKQNRFRHCIVCNYPFSDSHHLYPDVLGKNNSPIVTLCPNHHRFAHIIQQKIKNCESPSAVSNFIFKNFDPVFAKYVAWDLIYIHYFLNEYKGMVLRSIKFKLNKLLQERHVNIDHYLFRHLSTAANALERNYLSLLDSYYQKCTYNPIEMTCIEFDDLKISTCEDVIGRINLNCRNELDDLAGMELVQDESNLLFAPGDEVEIARSEQYRNKKYIGSFGVVLTICPVSAVIMLSDEVISCSTHDLEVPF